jgi:hypothetical protein
MIYYIDVAIIHWHVYYTKPTPHYTAGPMKPEGGLIKSRQHHMRLL